MPCGDNRIVTAFFDYLADRAVALGDAGSPDSPTDVGLRLAMLESRTVMDVLGEIADLLEIDISGLRSIVAEVAPLTEPNVIVTA